MQVTLKGKNVLITGGVRGIGRAMTEATAKAGARVIATYVSNPAAAQDLIGGFKAQGLDVHGCKLDVRNSADVDAALSQLETEFGPIDILINNAGIVKDDLILSRYCQMLCLS